MASSEIEIPLNTTDIPTTDQARFIVDDTEIPEAGQMQKSEFLSRLNSEVCDTVNEALTGTPFTSDNCPYLRAVFARHQNSTPLYLEQVMTRYEPATRFAQSAEGVIQQVKMRVFAAAMRWAQTGDLSDVPEEIASQIPDGLNAVSSAVSTIGNIAQSAGSLFNSVSSGIGEVASSIGSLFFKAKEGGAEISQSPLSVMRSLGKGNSIESSTRSKMEGAFGTSFSDVEVHTDSQAASLASGMNARAFAVGNHIAFGSSEHQPGTLIGDALMAHELAHVEQQKGATIQTKSNTDNQLIEKDADETAVGVMAKNLTGEGIDLHGKESKGLKTGLRLSSCSRRSSSVTRPPDLHSGTQIPDATRLGQLRGELSPGSVSPGGIPVRWDGAMTGSTLTPTATANRAAIKTELRTAMQNHLNDAMLSIRPMSTMPRIPITEFEGAGRAAQQVVDARFNSYTAQATRTAMQASTRSSFTFSASGANQNLFDANDRTQRSASGFAVNAEDLAGWIGSSDPSASVVNQSHHFNTDSTTDAQSSFFINEILTPFVAANRADLELYDLFGFAMSNEGTGRVVLGTIPDQSLSSTSSAPGVPSPAIRKTKWDAWKTLVHEYMHQLAHPAFNRAAEGGHVLSRVMTEGFAELFTKEVLTTLLPSAASNTSLSNTIEGGSFPPPTPDIVGTYQTPSDYAQYLTHVENIRDTVIGSVGGTEAVKSAFFQGHVEFIGLNPDGSWITPVGAGMSDVINVPRGITSLSNLATATGLSVAELQSVNPGLTTSSPLPSTVHAPGCREHIIVEALNTVGSSIVGRQTESKTQIANQNGVVEADLNRANPSVNWATLVEGQRILIPKH